MNNVKKINYMNILNGLFKIFWVFIIGCLFGFIVETSIYMFNSGVVQFRQGLIYGPFAQVYGTGAVAFYLILPRIKNSFFLIILAMLLGGIVEYFFSYFQELIFGSVSWDYSDMFLNIHGRTSLLYCICWGVLGFIYVKIIHPQFKKLDTLLTRKTFKAVTVCFIAFMIFNMSISWLAGYRQKERLQSISAKNVVDEFLDQHYPDYFLNAVYANRIYRRPIK